MSTRFGALILALGVVVAACNPATTSTPDNTSRTAAPTTPVAATPSATGTPSTPVPTVSAWREVDPNPLARIGRTYAPVWSGSRFIIAGYPLGNPPLQPRDTGFAPSDVVFLASPDGQTWSQGPHSKGYPLAYAFDGDAGVAVGSDRYDAAVWTSPDSETWSRLPNPPALRRSGQETKLSMNDVAHGPAGYVAVADLGVAINRREDVGASLILWSPDGRDWQRVAMGPFGDTQFTDLQDVVVVGGRYLISGTVYVPESTNAPASATPTLWASTDGRSWTKTPALEGGPDHFLELVAGPAGALLAGSETDPAGGHHCVAWHSWDGIAWTRTAEDCPRLLGSPGLVAAPFGFVASTPELAVLDVGGTLASPTAEAVSPNTTANPELPCAGGIQVSPTGDRWTCVPPPASGGLAGPGDIVAASATELLAIGSGTGKPNGEVVPIVWIADVDY